MLRRLYAFKIHTVLRRANRRISLYLMRLQLSRLYVLFLRAYMSLNGGEKWLTPYQEEVLLKEMEMRKGMRLLSE